MRALLRAGREMAVSAHGRFVRGARAPRYAGLCALSALAALVAGTCETQNAVANGDTRTIEILHEHTKESASITFKRDGRYDSAALQQLNWLLRDWRLDEPTKMDPRLFDVVWEARRSVGSAGPVHVVSAYRSPGTNAALRRRSKMVAEHSQHMLGKAMDFWLEDISVDQIRAIGMRMQRGGVGWYPNAGTPFVHLDVGSVRSWPRMGYDQLARLFPDGRTVHLPSRGGMLPGYEEAKTEILARGGSVAGYTQFASAEEVDTGGGRSLWSMLFGSRDDEDSSYYGLNNAGPGRSRATPAPVRVASASSEDGGTRGPMAYAPPQPDAADPLRSSLFRASAGRAVPLRGPAEPAQAAVAAVPAAAPPVTMPVPVQPVLAAMPLPPRRPDALAAFAAAHGLGAEPSAPLPPSRRLLLASADGTLMPAALAPVPVTPAPDMSDARQHLHALFAAAAAPPAPGRAAPVRVAAARPVAAGLPEGVIAAPASGATTRFRARVPESDLTAGRFSGSASRGLSTSR